MSGGWINGPHGALGEPMSDHLEEPRDFVDLDEGEEDAVDEIFDELDAQVEGEGEGNE